MLGRVKWLRVCELLVFGFWCVVSGMWVRAVGWWVVRCLFCGLRVGVRAGGVWDVRL